MKKRFSSINEEYHSECEESNEEFDSQNPTTIVHGVWNHHSYTVGHATTKVENFQFEFFLSFEIPQLFMFFNFALSSLFPSFFFIGYIYIYMWVYVLNNIHLLLFLQVAFSTKWMWSDPSPSMLNSTQSIHKFFMCILFDTRSKSSLCPCQLKNLRTKR